MRLYYCGPGDSSRLFITISVLKTRYSLVGTVAYRQCVPCRIQVHSCISSSMSRMRKMLKPFPYHASSSRTASRLFYTLIMHPNLATSGQYKTTSSTVRVTTSAFHWRLLLSRATFAFCAGSCEQRRRSESLRECGDQFSTLQPSTSEDLKILSTGNITQNWTGGCRFRTAKCTRE